MLTMYPVCDLAAFVTDYRTLGRFTAVAFPQYTIFLPSVVLTYYRQTSNIRRTVVGSKIVDHSDVVGASPVGAAPTTSSFST